jgi:apolipoprotein N-acyltransferase
VWTLAFPSPSLALAGWLAPALLLALCHSPRPRRVFALGYVAGLVHCLSSLYWILNIPYPPGAITGWLALSAYCALYPAVWVWFCWKTFPERDAAGIAEAWLRLRRMARRDRVLWPLQCALAWVALECLRGWMLTGFPWNYLAHSQLSITPLALFASITGVLGVSLVVAWCSVSLLVATTGSVHLKGARRWRRIAKDAAPAIGFLFFALAISWLYTNSREKQITGRVQLRIAMVQPSIPQQVIWDSYGDEKKAVARWEKLRKLTLEANATGPDLIVWPEASAPLTAARMPSGALKFSPVDELASTLGTTMVVGADEAVVELKDGQLVRSESRNSCFLLNRLGEVEGAYSKQHLVMFGEYVPMENWFPFLKKLAPVGTFTSGKGSAVFDLGKATAAPIICFEDVVPSLVRRAASEDVDFLLNLTNDGWFGEANQQRQHARAAAFRAIETGRPLVRCTNNGLTCWVDRFGRIHRLEQGSIHAAGVRVLELSLMKRAGSRATFYQRTGDWLGWGSVGACVLMLVWSWRSKNDSADEPDLA